METSLVNPIIRTSRYSFLSLFEMVNLNFTSIIKSSEIHYDPDNNKYETLRYKKNGFQYYTLKISDSENYNIKRRKRGGVEIVSKKENGSMYKIKIIDGIEVTRKRCR